MLKRFIDPNGIIDAVEIGPNFLTLYWNADEPGLETSTQLKTIRSWSGIIPDPFYHDPNNFHEGKLPTDEIKDWRFWRNKYACHFHFLMDSINKESITKWLNTIEYDYKGDRILSPDLKKEIQEYYTNTQLENNK